MFFQFSHFTPLLCKLSHELCMFKRYLKAALSFLYATRFSVWSNISKRTFLRCLRCHKCKCDMTSCKYRIAPFCCVFGVRLQHFLMPRVSASCNPIMKITIGPETTSRAMSGGSDPNTQAITISSPSKKKSRDGDEEWGRETDQLKYNVMQKYHTNQYCPLRHI